METTALSMAARWSLLDKAIMDAPVRGMLEFTVPGSGAYVSFLTSN